MTEVKTRTCLDCIHVKTWNHPGNYQHPPDSGWECTQPHGGVIRPDSNCKACYGTGVMDTCDGKQECFCWSDDENPASQAANCTDYQYNTPLTPEQQKAMEDEEDRISKTADVYERNADLYLEDDDN
jgi:hypothetical protein